MKIFLNVFVFGKWCGSSVADVLGQTSTHLNKFRPQNAQALPTPYEGLQKKMQKKKCFERFSGKYITEVNLRFTYGENNMLRID